MANNNITKTAHYKLNTIGRDQTDVLFIDYRDLEMGVGANSNAQIIDAEMYKMQTAINGKAGTAVATTSADGLMAKTDKAKLDGVAASANNYTHPANHPASMITGLPTSLPANGGNAATVNGKTVESNVPVNAKFTDTVYTHPNDANTRHVTDAEKTAWNGKASTAVVTTTANGLMIAADKTKLNGIAASANNYAHPSTHPASMITGLPTSLPANGGNADTLGSLSSKNYMQNIRNSNAADFLTFLQNSKNPTAYTTSVSPTQAVSLGLGNKWWHVSYYPNGDAALADFGANGYGYQVAYALTGGVVERFERTANLTTWSAWKNMMDANLLSGLALGAATNSAANKIVRTDSSGYLQAGWINTVSGTATGTLTRIYCSQDAYVRYLTPANFINSLGLAVKASPTFTGTVTGITKAMVGLPNVDNTTDIAKPVSTAQQTALNLKANLASPALTGVPTAPTAATATNNTQIATTAFATTKATEISNKVGNLTSLSTTNKSTIVSAVNEVFQSASSFKSSVATAITGKGVTTSATASKEVFVKNINAIKTGATIPSDPSVLGIVVLKENETPHNVYKTSFLFEGSGNTCSQSWQFTGNTYAVESIAVDSDGNVISGSDDGIVFKISPTGTEIWQFSQGTKVRTVAVDSHGNVFTGNNDNIVQKFSPTGNLIWRFLGHSGWIWSIAVDKQGNTYSGAWDNTLCKISSSGTQIWKFAGHTSAIFTVSVDSQGNVYTGDSEGIVHKISSSGSEVWKFTGHTGSIYGIAADMQGNVFSGSDDNTVRKISSNGKQLWSFTGHSGWIWSTAIDIQGNVYTGSFDNTARKISSNGSEIWKHTGYNNPIFAVAVDSQCNVYTGDGDNTIRKLTQNITVQKIAYYN